MSAHFAIRLIEVLFACAFLIQTIEFLFMLPHLSPTGILSWKNLDGEFRGKTKTFLSLVYGHNGFVTLLTLRLLTAVYLVAESNLILTVVALILHLLVLIRFKGNFNGGSDFMITQILLGLLLYYLLPARMSSLGLWYIGVQLLNSYFIAGIIKIKNPDWRSGRAVRGFLQTTTYAVRPHLKFLTERRFLALMFSWTVMAWEICFPLSLLDLKLTLILLGLGLFFHLGVWYTFGLNRFIFSWLSAYPALIYCVTHLNL